MLTQEQLQENIAHREQEVSQYETNYNNYTLMIESMGVIELPENLKEYIGKQNHELPTTLSLKEAELVSKYNYLEQIKKAQRTEFLEMQKTQIFLDVLRGQVVDV